MPSQTSQVPYNAIQAIGSVSQTDTRQPNDYFSVKATPNDFGAQVGEAAKGASRDLDSVADQAMKIQHLYAETESTNAETALIDRNSKAKADFMSKEGTEAFNALPDYQKSIQDNFQDIRSNLSPLAQRQFDMLGARQLANYNSDAASYASGQLKRANMLGKAQLINAAELSTTDPTNTSPQRIGEAVGDATFLHQSMIDETSPGVVQGEDGNFNFSDDARGQAAKANLQANIDNSKGIIWHNAISTVADQNPLQAQQLFDDHKDQIPFATQVRIQSFLDPKVTNYKADNAAGITMLQASQAHQQFLANPQQASSQGPNAFSLGNVKTASGAAHGTQDFVQPASPVDGVILAANNLRSKYQGMALSKIGETWTGESPQKASDWVNNVSSASGISPTSVPNLNDPAQLQSLLKGIATAEKTPKDLANFTDQVISQGVQDSLSGKNATINQGSPVPSANKNYATNPDGSSVTQADYYATHREDILAKAEAQANIDFPGNPTYLSMVRERVTQQMDKAISDQKNQYIQDNKFITKAIFGEASNGNAPATYQELRAIPGVAQVLDRVYAQDPKFAEGIDTMIAHAQKRNDVSNSPNAFEVFNRVLDNDGTNRIQNQDQLDKLMGRSDGTGINMKDYQDAKKMLEAPKDVKVFMSKKMKEIQNANGNIDGQGKQRAIDWYNNAANSYVSMQNKPDFNPGDISSLKDFMDDLDEKGTTQNKPGAPEQISNWFHKKFFGDDKTSPKNTPTAPATATGPNGEKYVLQGGKWVKQ